jgi:hypothetical protein
MLLWCQTPALIGCQWCPSRETQSRTQQSIIRSGREDAGFLEHTTKVLPIHFESIDVDLVSGKHPADTSSAISNMECISFVRV